MEAGNFLSSQALESEPSAVTTCNEAEAVSSEIAALGAGRHPWPRLLGSQSRMAPCSILWHAAHHGSIVLDGARLEFNSVTKLMLISMVTAVGISCSGFIFRLREKKRGGIEQRYLK